MQNVDNYTFLPEVRRSRKKSFLAGKVRLKILGLQAMGIVNVARYLLASAVLITDEY